MAMCYIARSLPCQYPALERTFRYALRFVKRASSEPAGIPIPKRCLSWHVLETLDKKNYLWGNAVDDGENAYDGMRNQSFPL
jgi:hypothetical protein